MGNLRSIEDFGEEKIGELFWQELGVRPEPLRIDNFRAWVKAKKYPKSKKEWPYNYFLWLIERIHEYAKKVEAKKEKTKS